MIDWRIYYGDGSTFDSSMGAPADAPGLDVQIVAEASELLGRELIHGYDYYVYDAALFDGWTSVDLFGLWDYLSKPGAKVVKFGRMVRHETFSATLARALDDPDLPPKSAYRDAGKGDLR